MFEENLEIIGKITKEIQTTVLNYTFEGLTKEEVFGEKIEEVVATFEEFFNGILFKYNISLKIENEIEDDGEYLYFIKAPNQEEWEFTVRITKNEFKLVEVVENENDFLMALILKVCLDKSERSLLDAGIIRKAEDLTYSISFEDNEFYQKHMNCIEEALKMVCDYRMVKLPSSKEWNLKKTTYWFVYDEKKAMDMEQYLKLLMIIRSKFQRRSNDEELREITDDIFVEALQLDFYNVFDSKIGNKIVFNRKLTKAEVDFEFNEISKWSVFIEAAKEKPFETKNIISSLGNLEERLIRYYKNLKLIEVTGATREYERLFLDKHKGIPLTNEQARLILIELSRFLGMPKKDDLLEIIVRKGKRAFEIEEDIIKDDVNKEITYRKLEIHSKILGEDIRIYYFMKLKYGKTIDSKLIIENKDDLKRYEKLLHSNKPEEIKKVFETGKFF